MTRGSAPQRSAVLDQLTDAATTIGRPTFRWIAGSLNCSMLSTQGEADELERRTTENFALGDETGEPDAFDYFAIAVMTARELQGRAMEVIDQLTEAAADSPEVPGYAAVAAMFHAENGDHERARGMLNEAANDNFEIRINNVWSTAIAAWAMTAHFVNDAAAAKTLYGLLAPWPGEIVGNQIFGVQTTDGLLGRLAAVLGNDDQAEAHFAAAEELTDSLGGKFFAANDDLARAGLHLARSDAAEPGLAERYATRSLENAQTNGYAGVEKRATDFLATLAAV